VKDHDVIRAWHLRMRAVEIVLSGSFAEQLDVRAKADGSISSDLAGRSPDWGSDEDRCGILNLGGAQLSIRSGRSADGCWSGGVTGSVPAAGSA